MPGGETEGASGGSSGTSDSSGRTSVALDVGCLESFNPKGEPHSLSQRWKRWKRAFNLYVTGKGVSNDAQKRALFLHVAGMDVQEIYFTLAADAESATFEATVKVFDDYFVPKTNVPFERHLFRQIVQESGETVDQFVCRLRQRAINCEFGGNEDDYIRDQVIDKCYSSKLRRKFLEKEGALTLDDLLRIARSQEAVDRQLTQYSTDQVNNQLTDHVNAVGDKSDGNTRCRKGKKCFSAIKKDISVETRSVQRVTKLAGCAVLLAILKLHAPGLVSVVVVIPDPEGIKVTKVLMVDGERLGADEVAVEEDVVVVMEVRKKQTLWLTGITDRFSIVPSLHFLWSSSLAMSDKVAI